MDNLDIALGCIARGWYVLPVPRNSKSPLKGLAPHGVNSATNDEGIVRRWWRIKPEANVGVACGKSGLAVLDCDKGNGTAEHFQHWVTDENIPETYTVRTGRRTNFGTHSYFSVPNGITSGTWNRNGRGGEIRSNGYYVLAAGSIHMDSGQPYHRLLDVPVAPLPEYIHKWLRNDSFKLQGDGELDNIRIALEKHEIDYDDQGDKLYVACPWINEHSCYSGPSEAALFTKNGLYCFKCHHSSCDGRGYSMYVAEVTK